LAIVPNPRYEHAQIFTPDEYKVYQDEKNQQFNELKNSKTEGTKGIIMKFFKTKKEEVSKVDADCFVEIKNDDGSISEVLVGDMVKAIQNAKEEDEKEAMNMDDEVSVGEEKMPLKELINKYQALCAEEEKENESEEDEKENESEEDEKENESEADEDEKENEDECKKDDEKQNHFEELKNAEKLSYGKMAVDLGMDKLARGKERY